MQRLRRIFVVLPLVAVMQLTVYAAPRALSEKEQEWLSHARRSEKEGWVFLHLEGEPFERGFQHGYLMAEEIKRLIDTESHLVRWEKPKDFDFFVRQGKRLFQGKISGEFEQELRGMDLGLKRAGIDSVDYDVLVAHNAYIELVGYWWPWADKDLEARAPEHELGGCSAFVATGSYTADGKVVMGHNTWFGYTWGAWCNVIADILPSTGHRILMQTFPGLIHSATDFFICSSGLMGTETTIGGFFGYDTSGTPEFFRVRQAMQYANSIDEWAGTMLERNTGAYANSWLLADVRTGEIARLELGLQHHSLEKKTDGYFCGSNIAADREILVAETHTDLSDIRNTNVARKERWKSLMELYRGKIDIEAGKLMLADHYDFYLQRERPGLRSICGHCELESGEYPIPGIRPFNPSGALDAKVADTRMALDMSFWARFGSACGAGFSAGGFLKQHPQYDWLRGYLLDRPARNWVTFSCLR